MSPLQLGEQFTLFFGDRPQGRGEGLQSCVSFPVSIGLEGFASMITAEKGGSFSLFSTFPPSVMPDNGAAPVIVQRMRLSDSVPIRPSEKGEKTFDYNKKMQVI